MCSLEQYWMGFDRKTLRLDESCCRYSVHPRGYMVHRPHKVTAAKQQFMAGLAIAAEASAAVRACCTMAALCGALCPVGWRCRLLLLACML